MSIGHAVFIFTLQECFRFCKFPTAGKTAPGVKIKLDQQKHNEDGTATGRREVVSYGRNVFMGYLNRENDTKVRLDWHFIKTDISVNVTLTMNYLVMTAFKPNYAPRWLHLAQIKRFQFSGPLSQAK